jgi:glycosyltransferase involved in cell wall biosynthesis
MKKVVFVSTVFPFPTDNGKKLVVSGILKYLFERHGAEQVTYILLGSEAKDLSIKNFPCRCFALGKPSVLYRLRNILWLALIKRAKSIQELMLYSPKLGRALHNIVADIGPDLVICDTFRVGQFFETPERFRSTYVLYLDDLFSARYQKMLDVLRRLPSARMNPLGNFARFVPSLLRPLVRISHLQKWILQLEKKLVEKREQNCVDWFNRCLLINGDEADFLRKKTGHPYIRTVKPLLTRSASGSDRHFTGKPYFIFLGALNPPHNHFSIMHFIEGYMDETIEKIPGVTLRVIGKGASEELVELAEKYAGAVSLEGFVENLDTVFRESCAMIVPLLFGSGVKIKTLEALSRGLPVISTSFGVEGIPVTNNVNCVVENDIAKYPQLMLAATDMSYNTAISRAAREFYFENYAQERVFEEYDLCFGTVDSA